jgi:Molecular chaperone (small heat shock protein)
MSTLQQIKSGVSQAWDNLIEGWQHLYRKAAGAITRFTRGDAGEEEQRELALRSAGWGMLPAEVFDDDEKVIVRMEVPGMESADFDIQVVENYLVVSGRKRVERERTEGRFHVLERAYGSFERAIPLPEEVVADEASASYRRGVLEVVLPKSSARRRRKIEVKVN